MAGQACVHALAEHAVGARYRPGGVDQVRGAQPEAGKLGADLAGGVHHDGQDGDPGPGEFGGVLLELTHLVEAGVAADSLVEVQHHIVAAVAGQLNCISAGVRQREAWGGAHGAALERAGTGGERRRGDHPADNEDGC